MAMAGMDMKAGADLAHVVFLLNGRGNQDPWAYVAKPVSGSASSWSTPVPRLSFG